MVQHMMGLGMSSEHRAGAAGGGVGPFFFFSLGEAYHWRSAQTRTVSSAAVSQYLSRRRRCPKVFVCPKRRGPPFSVDTRAASGDFVKGGPGGDLTASRNRKTGTAGGRGESGDQGSLDVYSSSGSPAKARRARVRLGVALQLGPLKFCEIRANQEGIPIRKNQRNEEDDGLFKGVTEGWDKKTCRGSSNRRFVPWLGRVLFAILQLHE